MTVTRPLSDSADLAELRSRLGRSTEFWAGHSGTVTVEDGRWSALSGMSSVDYNVILCHGPNGGDYIARSVADISAARVPALIMLAGETLGSAQELISAGWVCVGAIPLMFTRLTAVSPVAGVRRIRGDELPRARAIIQAAFRTTPELSVAALADAVVEAPGQSAWGLFEGSAMMACMGSMTVDRTVIVWSMAAAHQRRGYGRCLLKGVLSTCQQEGATASLLHASAPGEPFYSSVGYQVLERWQLWSRPRWVFGRI